MCQQYRLKRHNRNLVTSGSPTPIDLFLELDSLNSSSNQEQNSSPSFSIFEKNLPSLKEARKVAIIIGVVIFLGIGYIARFTLTIDETISVGYNLLFRYVCFLDCVIINIMYFSFRGTTLQIVSRDFTQSLVIIRGIYLCLIFEMSIWNFITNSKKNQFRIKLNFFFMFELDFYCLCSLQKSISKSN